MKTKHVIQGGIDVKILNSPSQYKKRESLISGYEIPLDEKLQASGLEVNAPMSAEYNEDDGYFHIKRMKKEANK